MTFLRFTEILLSDHCYFYNFEMYLKSKSYENEDFDKYVKMFSNDYKVTEESVIRYLILNRTFLLNVYRSLGKPISIIITFILTLIGWVIFRSDNLSQAFSFLATMFDFTNPEFAITIMHGTFDYYLEARYVIILIVSFLICFLPAFKIVEQTISNIILKNGKLKVMFFKSFISFLLLYICITEVITTGVNPFIYFRF